MLVENKTEIWAKRIREMRASGKPQKQWCVENGIKYNTIRSWLSKDLNEYKKNKFNEEVQKNKPCQNKATQDKPSKWLKVNLETNSSKVPVSGGIIEIKIGKFSVNVRDAFNEGIFTNIMKSLLELC